VPLAGKKIQNIKTWNNKNIFSKSLFSLFRQEPEFICRRYLDGQLLAAAHAGQAGGAGAERQLLSGSRGPPGQKMCLLEEVLTSAAGAQ
jgi:hypothetical protein